jgi:plasmid replication initiation protein
MARKVNGGIEKHHDLKRFNASATDIAAKDQIDLMSRCWFSLTPNRTDPIEYEFVNLKTKQPETIRITGSSEHGIATVHDQDLIIFAMSQWIEGKRLGMELTRRINFTPYQFFTWMNKPANGASYARLREALHRLKTTNIETTVRSENKRKNRVKQFSWISEWAITEEDGRVEGIEVVLAEWLFESIHNFDVLTLDKRYFDIPGSVERSLYLYAKKATGGATGTWRESFKSLYGKSASQQDYKHYANALRKLVQKNDLPGLSLSRERSSTGKEMLVMKRTEKRVVIDGEASQQLALIEFSPLEEAWENVMEILRLHLGEATVNSWLKPLHVVSFDEGTLTYRAPMKFSADWVETHYRSRLQTAWKSLGYEVTALRFETPKKEKAA